MGLFFWHNRKESAGGNLFQTPILLFLTQKDICKNVFKIWLSFHAEPLPSEELAGVGHMVSG